MSISHDSASTIVCKEVFDENSQPSEKEVLDYARRLGIDPDTEPYLLDLAREGLMAALPKGWTPVFDENTKTFYYHQRSTNHTTWEHPLDPIYKDLVAQARASNRRRASVAEEEASRSGEDVEEEVVAAPPAMSGLPPPVPVALRSPGTRLPTKLAPLKRHRSSEGPATTAAPGPRPRPDGSLDRLARAWRSGDAEPEAHSSGSARSSSLSGDRTSRDYTNLRFQDPEFYESPRLVEQTGKRQLDLRDVLKRSESLSPRHETDWKQLSSRFSSDENIIDVDALRAKSLGARAHTPDSPIAELAAPQLQQQQQQQQQQQKPQHQPRELTLSGGGAIFLKSNRSRDATPCRDDGRLEDFQAGAGAAQPTAAPAPNDEMTASAGESLLKSILREKPSEDDDRPEEERKSVRFDLERMNVQTASTRFNGSGSDDTDSDDGEPSDRRYGVSVVTAERRAAAVASLQQVLNRKGGPTFEGASVFKKVEPRTLPKVVASRFVVENVSEQEHLDQQEDRSSLEHSDDILPVPKKFENIKNIDLVSRSDSERTTPRSSEPTRSSYLEELRRNKEIMLANMRKSEQRKLEEATERPGKSDWSTTMLRSLEMSREGGRSPTAENPQLALEMTRNHLAQEHELELRRLRQELDARLEATKRELEEEFREQRLTLEASTRERLAELKREMAEREEAEVKRLVAEMDEARSEKLQKLRAELEACYEKERQDILTSMKAELDQRKRELLELRSQELTRLEDEHERGLDGERQAKAQEMELARQHSERIESLKRELDKEFDNLRTELRAQQREKITKITEDHEKCLADILRDFRIDEGLARKVYKQKLEEIRADYSKDLENEIKKQGDSAVRQESVDFEKIRCEKRLIEDKYNTLKEKYLKLKKDMRIAIEKRNRHKEQQANATASETEMSTSTRTRTERTESTDQKSPLTKTNSISNSKPKEVSGQNYNALKEQRQQQQQQPDAQQQQRGVAAERQSAASKAQKFESDDTTTCSETTSNLLVNKKKCFTKKLGGSNNKINNNLADNPVENIRKQLEKLEDLGDQLPSNETAYTVRYPFQDKSPTNVSSELEFFRHRIHVERDSVKRARDALRQQRSAFQSRQRAWKQRSARATLEQLVKEERELSDMEVSLHRTRSLLGEKVIHLRHLEQSLERVASARRNENESSGSAASAAKSDEVTLSDMSSASSGFSSTDLGTDTFIESTEIIASLENLNSEIREIWGVLNKRQDNSVPPPPTLMFTDLSWFPYQHLTPQPPTVPAAAAFGTPNIQSNILSQLTGAHPAPGATQNIIAQYGPTSGYTTSVGTVEGAAGTNLMERTRNIVERTRNLKDWLRQARAETSDLVSPGQATL